MIPHNKPTIGEEEKNAAVRVLSSSWLAQGLEVQAFENDLCNYFGLAEGHALAVSSGSSALYLALWVLNAKGKKIGLPVYSCRALQNAVSLVGGKAFYMDCGSRNPNTISEIEHEQNIDILIAASIYGFPIEIKSADTYYVIEDIAQSFGAEFCGKPIGMRGTVGVCSFYATKMLTSGGQGGAILSRDKNLIDAIRDYRQFDARSDNRPRFNFQMTDLQAAIGRVQLRRINEFIELRHRIYEVYSSVLDNLLDISSAHTKPVRYRAICLTPNSKQIMEAMKNSGVMTIVPIQEDELLDCSNKYENAKILSKSTLSIPIYPSLKIEQAHRIARLLKKYS